MWDELLDVTTLETLAGRTTWIQERRSIWVMRTNARIERLGTVLQERQLPAPDGRTWLAVFEHAAREEGAPLVEVLAWAKTRTATRARRVAIAIIASRGYSLREIAAAVGCHPPAILEARRWTAAHRPRAISLTTSSGSL